MVLRYLSTKNNLELITTNERWPSDKFMNFLLDFDGNFVVNCIGAIHQRTNEFRINVDLPIWLDRINKKYKIIHPGTDCESDNDEYGISKRKATDYLLKEGKDTTIIKTSIIGPELNTKASLLEWFLNTDEKEIGGYNKYFWNGNTTLQWSKICYKILCDFYRYDTLNIPTSNCISKGDLLKVMKEVFNKKIKINNNPIIDVNKCLTNTYDMPNIDIKTQLKELKKFYYE